jgi:micrococcal nuclease
MEAGQVRFGHGQFSRAKLYHYRAKITAVYDGDTCTADVDLGFKVVVCGEKIRLARINALEIRGASRKEGLVARDFLRELILGKEVLLKTIRDKRGKYGRYLGEIIVTEGSPQCERQQRLGQSWPREVRGVLIVKLGEVRKFERF